MLEFDNGRYVPLRDCFYIRTITIMGARSRNPRYFISIRFIYLYIVWTVRLRVSTYIQTLGSVTSVRLTEVSMSYIYFISLLTLW
jgi:hypothetical protein